MTVGLNPANATPQFSSSFNGQLGSLGWDTGDLLIAEFGTAANPIRTSIGTIVGGADVQVIPPIHYPPPFEDDLLFEGVRADTRSGLRVSAEVYGRAGIVAGATLNFGGVSGNLNFDTNPSVEIPNQIRPGRFFNINGIGPGLDGSSSLDITAPGVDFDLDLVLDVDARGKVEYGLYPFAGYTVGEFHLPDIFPDIDLCEVISFPANLANPDFNICEGDPNNDALIRHPINLPRAQPPPGVPDPPAIQVGEFQLVNPVAALTTTTRVDPVTNKLQLDGNTDLVRLAADIDGIIGGATIGTSELSGGRRNLPSDENPIVELSYDLIDIKYGPEFGYDFNASVDSKLDVHLDFSSPVIVGTNPTPVSEWQGPWDEIPPIALLSSSPVDVDVDFTGFETDLRYESRFTLADYLEIKALELRLALKVERLGLGPVATAALKKALKIPPLGPLLYDKRSLLGKAEFDDLPAIELEKLLDIDLTSDDGLINNSTLWDGAFTLTPEPIEEVFMVNGNASLNDPSSYRKFSAPGSAPSPSELANSVIVLGTYAGNDPGTRLDATPIVGLDAGGTLAVQGIYVPEGTIYRMLPGAERTFQGTDLLTVENDGVLLAGSDGLAGSRLRFHLDNPNIPLVIMGKGIIGFSTSDAVDEISAQQVFHGAGHQLAFADDPGIQSSQTINATNSFLNLGDIEVSSDLTVTSAALTNGETGDIVAFSNGTIELENLIENLGVVRSIGNSRVTIHAGQFNPTMNGPTTEGDFGHILAAQGGEIDFVDGSSRPFAGNQRIEAASGGTVTFEKRITVAQDSVVELVVQQNSTMTLNGLGLSNCINCEEDARVVITNRGLLELASGRNSLRVPSGFSGEDIDDVIVPIDLENTGTIRILEGAELLFDFAIENYSGSGATFAGGTWELIGNPEPFDNRTPPPNPAFFETTPETWAYLDMQVGDVPRDAELIDVELPLDELTTALRFNAADVLLSGAALFPYFNTVEVNLGTIRFEQMQQFHTAGQFENRGGEVAVQSGAGLFVHGPLQIRGGSVSITGAGSTLEVAGGSFEQDDGSLARRDIEINGGTLAVSDAATFDHLRGGRTWIVRDRLVDDGIGGEISQPGVFDLGSRQIRFNANSITIEGEMAAFEAARYIATNAGELHVGRGHTYSSLATALHNHAGATLSVVGGQFLIDGPVISLGSLVVDPQSRLQADLLQVRAGTAELHGVIEAETIVDAGATLRGDGLFAYDLTLLPGSTIEVEYAGPDVMFTATVDGAFSILLPADYAAPAEQGESLTYALLEATTLGGVFDSVLLDGSLVGSNFGFGDEIEIDAGGGLTRTLRFLAERIELIETLGTPKSRVPEPATAVLLLIAGGWAAARRRCRHGSRESLSIAFSGAFLRQRGRPLPWAARFASIGASLALVAVPESTLVAATFDWDRGADTDQWGDGANWDQGTAIPGPGDMVSLVGAGPSGAQTIDLGGVVRDILAIDVADPDASYTFTNGTLASSQAAIVGGTSHATMNMLVGGAMTAGELRIAENAVDSGAVNVDGAASTLAVAAGNAFVGAAGFGQLGITGGATVTAENDLTVGDAANSLGVVNIRGSDGVNPSTLSVGGRVEIGSDGNGTLRVEEGAALFASTTSDSALVIGENEVSTGAVLVRGVGSRLVHQGSVTGLIVGLDAGNEAAPARLDVTDGGGVEANGFFVGLFIGSQGVSTIGGLGSYIEAAGRARIASSGNAALEIRSGGRLTVGDLLEVGATQFGNGSLRLSGPGSALTADADMIVGNSGVGELIVEDGAAANIAGAFTAAADGGAEATVRVSSATLNVEGTMTFGAGPNNGGLVADASARVSDGGLVAMNDAAGSIDIAIGGFARGHVIVGDSDRELPTSILRSAGGLRLAPDGSNNMGASLTVRPTGLVDVVGTATIGSGPEGALLFLEGGTIQAAAYNIASDLNVQFNSGTIRVMGDQTLDAATIAKFGFDDADNNPGTTGAPKILEGQHLKIDGIATLVAPLVIDGGRLSIGSASGNDLSLLAPLFGATTTRTGRVDLTNTSLSIGSGGMLGDALVLAAGQTLDVTQSIFVAGDGSLSLEGGTLGVGVIDVTNASSVDLTGGVLQFGTVVGDLLLEGATLAPGRRVGGATLVGSLTQNSGVLEIEIGGSNLGEFDQLTITGTAAIAGTLNIRSTPDYSIPENRGESHVFEVLRAASITGMFDAVAYDGLQLAAGVNYVPTLSSESLDGLFRSVVTTGTDVTLTNYLAELGDANGDGSVDGVDLAAIEANFGGDGDFSQGDFNGSGTVGGSDFLDWQRNVDAPLTLQAAFRPVPEPAGISLALFMIAGLGCKFRG